MDLGARVSVLLPTTDILPTVARCHKRPNTHCSGQALFDHLFGTHKLNRRNRPAAALTARDPFCALRRTQADGKQHIQLILRRRHDVWRQTHSHPAPFGRA